MHRKVVTELGIPLERAIEGHPTYGNTASVSVATATWEYLRQAPPTDGTRLVLVALGAGLTGCAIAGEWVSA
jgi:3-oxoacyl-[acyl-carrier-protein] synthase III